MSKNRNRTKLNKAETNKEYKVLSLIEEYPPYWDDGIIFYPRYKRGSKNPLKRIFSYQVRMYRTWKYNRKTKWKQKKKSTMG